MFKLSSVVSQGAIRGVDEPAARHARVASASVSRPEVQQPGSGRPQTRRWCRRTTLRQRSPRCCMPLRSSRVRGSSYAREIPQRGAYRMAASGARVYVRRRRRSGIRGFASLCHLRATTHSDAADASHGPRTFVIAESATVVRRRRWFEIVMLLDAFVCRSQCISAISCV